MTQRTNGLLRWFLTTLGLAVLGAAGFLSCRVFDVSAQQSGLESRISACEKTGERLETALIRIEAKLDRLVEKRGP